MISDEELDVATVNLVKFTGYLCKMGKAILESKMQPDILEAYVKLMTEIPSPPPEIKFALIQARGWRAYYSVMEQAEAAFEAKKADDV